MVPSEAGSTKFRVFNNGGTSIGINNQAGTPDDGLYVEGSTGMGVSDPTQKLEVDGAIKIGDSVDPVSDGTIRYGNNGLEVFDNGSWQIVQVQPSNIEIGDNLYGGIVFWLDERGEHGLVVRDEDLNATYEWGTENCCYFDADGGGVYGGKRNSYLIIQGTPGSSITCAAKACQDLTTQGYGDWYLPNRSEFSILRVAATNNPNITLTSDFYWTSEEQIDLTDVKAWAYSGIGSTNELQVKSTKNKVRAIRSF